MLREKDLSPEIYRKLAEEVDQICREQDQMLILNTAPAAAAQLGMRSFIFDEYIEGKGDRWMQSVWEHPFTRWKR